MQVVYDTAYLAKGYAEEFLDKKLTAQGITSYKIDGIAYGFATSEIPYVFVSFLYSYGEKTETYGYKFNVNEELEAIPNIDKDAEIEYSNIFTLIDESVEIGKFSYPNNESLTEVTNEEKTVDCCIDYNYFTWWIFNL